MSKLLNLINGRIKAVLSSELNKRIFHHSFWILTGNILSKLSLLVATILVTQHLGKHEYGEFGIIKSTILMFAMFAGMELGITATKYISQYRFTDKQKVERIVGLSTFFALIISIIIGISVYFYAQEIAMMIKAPQIITEIRISAFILFFSSLNGIQSGILAGLENFKQLSINNAVAGVVSSIAMVVASRYLGLQAVVVAFGLNYLFLFILNFRTLNREFYKIFSISIFKKDNFKESQVLWKFSFPAIFAGIMVGPVTWLCNYFLIQEHNGFEQMADFDIAHQWRSTILFIPTALAQIALPLLSQSVDRKSDYKHIFNKNIKLNFFIAFGIVTILILISPVIIRLYSDNYQDALVPLIIMFVTTGFIAVNNVVGQAIASQGKMWLGLLVNFIWAGTLIGTCMLFVSHLKLGATGLAVAYLLSYVVHTLIQFLYIKKIVR